MNANVPLRALLPTNSKADALCLAARKVVRIRLLAEGAEARMAALDGCEIERTDMLELFGLLTEEAEAAHELLSQGGAAC